MREVLKIYDNSRMSVGATPSLNFIGDTVGDTAPHAMSEMRGIRFATGNSPTTGAISLSDFRNQVITRGWTRFEEPKIVASDAAQGDLFGGSVAISGDYAIMGARGNDGPSNSGSAYIFRRTGTNTWDAGTQIVASDRQQGDEFGRSVAISGDYAIVGAPYNSAGATDSGSAYIFRRTGTNTWDAGTKLIVTDPGKDDFFGGGVGISGDYAIVGAFRNDVPTDSGSAYIFRRTGTNTWDAGTKIVASDAAQGDFFGGSVGISGDYAIVGADGNDDGGGSSGSAYIFRRTGTNTWDAGTRILASDAAASDQFGLSVAIDGDYAVVGAYKNDDPTDSGSAYIFRRTDINAWDAGKKIVASDAAQGDNFGSSVGISGDYAIVGASKDDDPLDSGSAYIFRRTGTNDWDAGKKIVATDPADYDQFGGSVGISGGYAIVGAWGTDGGGGNSGSAYTFVNSFYV
jgi:hypothetical protein